MGRDGVRRLLIWAGALILSATAIVAGCRARKPEPNVPAAQALLLLNRHYVLAIGVYHQEPEPPEVRIVALADRPRTIASFEGYYPALWSPDGQWLAYEAPDSSGWNQLWVCAPDGSRARMVTDVTDEDSRTGKPLTWGREGALYYTVLRYQGSGHREQLWRVNLGSGERERLVDLPRWALTDSLTASPQGGLLAFEVVQNLPRSGRDIWTVTPGGTNMHAITRGPYAYWHCAWSADGAWLYCISDALTEARNYAQYARRLPSVERMPATESESTETGRKIAALQERFDYREGVYRMRPDGTRRELLVRGQRTIQAAAVSSSGAIAYADDKDAVFLVEKAGRPRRVIASGFWLPGRLSWSADGRLLAMDCWSPPGSGGMGVAVLDPKTGTQTMVARYTKTEAPQWHDWRPTLPGEGAYSAISTTR
ncbi:MAG: hypothetical protein FJX75_17140 [Armatimonadetes bacterium]|nr:hypothetical protein [Armatimonadota bacterium]